MKKLTLALILLCAAAVMSAQKSGDKIAFSAKNLEGEQITDSIFENNKLTMLNIWGTFCPPCIKEMPDLARLNEANKARGVEVVGIVIDFADRSGNVLAKQKKDADTIIAGTGADYKHIVPSPAMMAGFLRGVQAVPSTIFVDQSGKMVGEMYLGARSQKDWQKIIDDILAGRE